MRAGLFGKLPAKRNFIAIRTPQPFLDTWEPWVQGSVAASRQLLGEAWLDAYMTAPIWRFWLGAGLCGATVIGAFMPSVDGVGRYFPLTIFSIAPEEHPLSPPEIDAQTEWFKGVENLLLSALNDATSFEKLTDALDTLAPPTIAGAGNAGRTEQPLFLRGGATTRSAPQQDFETVFCDLRLRNHASAYADRSFWWTIGGENFEPQAIAATKFIDPYIFAGLMTGKFDDLGA